MEVGGWSSDEEEGDRKSAFHKDPSYCLIVIDTSPKMFLADDEGVFPFKTALQACYEVADSLLLSSAGTQKSLFAVNFATNDSNRQKLTDFLDSPLVVAKSLRGLIDKNVTDLDDEYRRSGSFDLGLFLINCRTKFTDIKKRYDERNLIIVTNDDDPVESDLAKKMRAMNEAKYFVEAKVNISVLTLSSTFNTATFYKEFLDQTEDKEVLAVADMSELADEIASNVKVRFTQVGTKFYPFKDKWEKYLKIQINNYVAKVNLLNNAHVTRQTHEEVVKYKEPVEDDGTEKRYSYYFSDLHDRVPLNYLEKGKLKDIPEIPVGLILLYLTNDKLIPSEWVCSRPYLVNVHAQEGSELYDLFWEYCCDEGKVAVCLQKLRKNGPIFYIQMTPKSVDNRRMFLVKRFPSRRTVLHQPKPKPNNHVSQELTDALSGLVEKLTFDYDVQAFSNVYLERKKAYIKSQLLDEDEEGIIDPYDEKMIDDAIRSEAETLNKLMPSTIKGKGKGKGQKRSATTQKAGASKKSSTSGLLRP